ncbi:MAG TPA: GNAT family protein [Bacteroidia bacterium]|nr:GNAT family protein [Bacteroidia bacterium]
MLPNNQVILSPIHAEDLPKLFEWINNEDLVSLNAYFKPVSWEAHLKWFENEKNRNDVSSFGIRLRSNQQLIGSCKLQYIHPIFQSAELQIRIGEADYLSKGLGSEAVRLLLSHGFDELKLNRIYLEVFTDNERAIKSYLKNGFLKEGVLREAGFVKDQRKDLLVMSILKAEFNAH